MDGLTLLSRLFGTHTALRRWSVASLVANIGIIVTGAVVRLTGSGLGCPTWPRCDAENYIPRGELGIHGAIEFGNRLLTFVLIALALGAAITAFRIAAPPLIRWLTVIIAVGIPFQGVIGGITVLTGLNPWVVSLHLVLSVALVVLCTRVVVSVYDMPVTPVTPVLRMLVMGTFVTMMISIYLGTVVTGSGPHSGDGGAARTGFHILPVAQIHALAVWIAMGGTVLVVLAAQRQGRRMVSRLGLALLASGILQGAIGYLQFFTHLPTLLVMLHMLGIGIVATTASALLFGVGSAQKMSGSTAAATKTSAR